jgi:hypothetical protein
VRVGVVAVALALVVIAVMLSRRSAITEEASAPAQPAAAKAK